MHKIIKKILFKHIVILKMTLDTRPYDTANTINIRSRIRLCSFLSLLLVFLYIGIQESFSGAHISYLHTLHIFIQPIILLAAVLDFSAFPGTLSLVHIAMLVVDVFVTAMSAISVSRCFAELTATCAERVYEKGVWILIAGSLSLLDVIMILQLRLLDSQLKVKDIHEAAEVERLKVTGDVPSWNSILVFKNKIKVINIYMIPFDVTYFLCVWQMTENAPIYFLSIGHLIINPFLLITDLGFQRFEYETFRIVYILLLGCNVLMMIVQLQTDINEISKMLALFISILYVVTDANQIVYFSQIVETIQKYKAYKRSL